MAVQYQNGLSRRLFGSFFRNQWVIPRAPHPAVSRFLRWYERKIAKPDIGGIDVDRPIFVISLPRSGSSMLQDLLAAHDDTAYINNMMHLFWPDFCGAECLRRRLRLNVEGERFLGDSVTVAGDTPSDPVVSWADWYKLDLYDPRYVRRTPEQLGDARIRRMHEDIRKVLWCFKPGGGARFLSKNPGLLPHIDLTAALFPDARFIYLVRDPRPCANSMVKLYKKTERQRRRIGWARKALVPFPHLPRLDEYVQAYGPDSLETTARLWRDAADFMDPWISRLANMHVVKYENIIDQPAEQVENILRFCELNPAGAQNDVFQQRMERIGRVQHANTEYGGFDRIEKICKKQMKRLWYA